MKKIILTLTALTTFAFGAIQINDDMSNFSHLDQFDKIHNVTSDTKKMIFAFTKSSGHMVKEFLTNKNDDYLTSKNIMYIADVSSMPTIIQWFVLPTFKDYNFPIIIINDDKLSNEFKKDEPNIDKIIVVVLKNKIVTQIKYFNNVTNMELYLEN